MSTLLEVSGVSKSFDGFKAINKLSFQIGEPEMDALMTCDVGYVAENLVRPEWEFVRMQTRIMQGASHCDFRWCKE